MQSDESFVDCLTITVLEKALARVCIQIHGTQGFSCNYKFIIVNLLRRNSLGSSNIDGFNLID